MTDIKRKRGPILGSTRPDRWVSGPDPEIHALYKPYIQQINQARWRGEEWDDSFTFKKWLELWGDLIKLRGRKIGYYVMIRKDPSKAWSIGNVELKLNGGENPPAHNCATNIKEISCSLNVKADILHTSYAKLTPARNIL